MPCINLAAKSRSHQKPGFTIIEVMLVLGLTGLLLVGVLSTTFSSIAAQRYNDSVRSFAEYLRTVYSEVISPETLGLGVSSRYVLGKILVFGYDYGNASDNRSIYVATVVGTSNDIPTVQSDFMTELATVDASLYCSQTENSNSDIQRYELLWDAELRQINDSVAGLSVNNRFTGSIIIARSPTSGTVHTVYTKNVYNLRDNCRSGSSGASSTFTADVRDNRNQFVTETVGFCVKSNDSSLLREVRIAADGRNTSAISIISDDGNDSWDEEGRNRCY